MAGCLLAAAVGCSQEPRIVEAELPADMGAAGGASVAPSSDRPDSQRSRTLAQGGGSSTKNGATSNAEVAAASDDGLNYGWVNFENAPFGQGKTPNAQLRRPLEVTILGEETMVGKGYVMRSSLTTAYADVAITITNSSPETRCFIKAQDVIWRTADGDEIPGDSHAMTYLSGSVANANGTPTTTCLAPGERGYFLEVQAAEKGQPSLFDVLAEVELTLSSSTSRFERPQYRVLPIKWSGSASSLSVTFENMGLMPAPVDLGEGQFIMTDADGLPLTWGFLDVDRRVTMLPPGSEVVLKSDVYYDGKVSNMLVSFGY